MQLLRGPSFDATVPPASAIFVTRREESLRTPVQRWIDEMVATNEIAARTPNDLGGPVASFDWVGRAVLILLLEQGICPSSKVLDLGCGAARVAYWLIRLLDRGKYFGIEPDEARLKIGTDKILGAQLMEEKAPRFSREDSFDLTVFGETFDYVFARSVWSHCARIHIERTLDSLVQCLEPDGIALLSFYPAVTRDGCYMGTEWSWPPVRHLPRWISGTVPAAKSCNGPASSEQSSRCPPRVGERPAMAQDHQGGLGPEPRSVCARSLRLASAVSLTGPRSCRGYAGELPI